MEKPYAQNLKNHVRLVPAFHFFVLPVLIVNFINTIVHLVRFGFSYANIFGVILSFALFLFAGLARTFALNVQDRVIRLEMQTRMERLLAPELRPRIGEFSMPQIIALRFAGDDELPILCKQALDEQLAGKVIKQRVKNWRPDFARA